MKYLDKSCVALALALLLAGCAIYGGTGSDQPDQTVLAAGDIGAVGCAAFALQGRPSDVALARIAVDQLDTVLKSSNPTVSAFSAVCTQAPEKYGVLCSVVLNRIGARLGDSDVLPKDGVPFQALSAFAGACKAALG